MKAFLWASAACVALAGCTVPQSGVENLPVAQATDTSEDARIADLISRMSVERKVAQLIQPQINSFTAEDMRRYRFGSYLNGGNGGPYGNEYAEASEWLKLADEMYLASVETDARRRTCHSDHVGHRCRSWPYQYNPRHDLPSQHCARRHARCRPRSPRRRSDRSGNRGHRDRLELLSHDRRRSG